MPLFPANSPCLWTHDGSNALRLSTARHKVLASPSQKYSLLLEDSGPSLGLETLRGQLNLSLRPVMRRKPGWTEAGPLLPCCKQSLHQMEHFLQQNSPLSQDAPEGFLSLGPCFFPAAKLRPWWLCVEQTLEKGHFWEPHSEGMWASVTKALLHLGFGKEEGGCSVQQERAAEPSVFGVTALGARFGTGSSRFVLCSAPGSLAALSRAAAPGQTPQSISCHHRAPPSTSSRPWEEDKDGGDTGGLFSGPAFTISFLPGHARAVKPFPV